MIIDVFGSRSFTYHQLAVTREAQTFEYDGASVFLDLLISGHENVQRINGFAKTLVDWMHRNNIPYSVVVTSDTDVHHDYTEDVRRISFVQSHVEFKVRIKDPEAQLLYKLTFGSERVES